MRETGLPVMLRLAGRPVMLIGQGPAAEAKRRLLERAGAEVVGEDGAAAIAIVADGDADAVARLKARGMLVNATDRPELCDFTLPAIVDRDPVLVAVATGGASAGLAAALRQRIEALLPSSLGALANALREARAPMRERHPEADARRRAPAAALAEGGPLDPLLPHAPEDVATWLSGSEAVPARLVRIMLHSPDPDRLTLGEAQLLGRADRVYHRPDVPDAILDRARADAERIAGLAPPADPGEGLSIDLEMAR